MNDPILVNSSPLPDMVMALGRDAGKLLAAYALGKGWIQGDDATLLAGLGGLALVAYGQWKTFKRANQLSTIAASPETPDHLAQIK